MKKTLFFIAVTIVISLKAQTKVASIFGSKMVLQRNTNVKIWGTDKPNKTIIIQGSWGSKVDTKTDANGNWITSLKTEKAGGPYILKISGSEEIILDDILLGEVWLCGGQSNMTMTLSGGPGQHIEGGNTMILNSKNSNLRFFTVKKAFNTKPLKFCKGNWETSKPETAAKFSAVAYSFGLRLQKYLGVPVGLISSNLGGTPAQAWTPKEIIEKEFPEFTKDLKKKTTTKTATGLYNGMISPLIPYTIKGVIWYQGEGNRWNPEQYSRLFPAMIKSWRTNWNQADFPFYFVQLAPFGNNLKGWVGIQQAQLKTLQTTPNTGMAVINDIGDKARIHPSQKKEVGERLALLALAKNYNVKGITYASPIYKSMKIENNKILVDFNNAPLGITSLGNKLNDFEIAGEDGVYYPANAKIIKKGAFLEVWNDKITSPKNIRYAWKSYVRGSLFNTAGLPASCFTTEDWSDVFSKK